jgi:hypothetical protein
MVDRAQQRKHGSHAPAAARVEVLVRPPLVGGARRALGERRVGVDLLRQRRGVAPFAHESRDLGDALASARRDDRGAEQPPAAIGESIAKPCASPIVSARSECA